jgi:hypothetical protein
MYLIRPGAGFNSAEKMIGRQTCATSVDVGLRVRHGMDERRIEMRKITIAALMLFGALAAPAHSAVLTSTEWGYYRNQLSGDPWLRNRSVEECSHGAITAKAKEQLSKLMDVREDNVRFEFCRRLFNGYVSGAVSYKDYAAFETDHVASPNLIRALKRH